MHITKDNILKVIPGICFTNLIGYIGLVYSAKRKKIGQRKNTLKVLRRLILNNLSMDITDKAAKVARISDIIEQIEGLNEMIDFHRNHQGDASTISQYEYMRDDFVKELNELMLEFKLDVRLAEPSA